MITEVSPHASVTLDGSGNGQVPIGPPSGAVWQLRLASMSTTGTVKQPQAFLYRGSTSGPLEQIDSTYLGNSASSGKVAGAPFFPGQVLWAKWTGGDPGAIATLQAYGQQGRRGELNPFDQGPVGEGFPLNVATVFQAGNTIAINSAGEFIYNGTPAAGNLIGSWSNAAGEDDHNNAYPKDLAIFDPVSGNYLNLSAAEILLQPSGSATGGLISQAGNQLGIVPPGVSNADPRPTFTLLSGSVAGGTPPQIVTSSLYAIQPNAGFSTAEVWHTIANPSGFTGLVRYKLSAENEVKVQVNLSGTLSGGGTLAIGTLSGVYVPKNECRFPWGNSSTAATQSEASVSTAGVISAFGLPTTATRVTFMVSVPLD